MFIEGEKANIFGLKKDFEDLREVEHAQVSMLKTGLDGVANDLISLRSDYGITRKTVEDNLVPTVENIDTEWKAFKKLDIDDKVKELSDGIDSAAANKSLEFLKLICCEQLMNWRPNFNLCAHLWSSATFYYRSFFLH